jgi:pimeloyl-ACP methyl ester carboxylesterase
VKEYVANCRHRHTLPGLHRILNIAGDIAMVNVISRILILLCCATGVSAQVLQPGFDATEYIDVLERSNQQVEPAFRGKLPKEAMYARVYRSPEVGLHNQYEIWLHKDKSIMAINLRGSTSDMDSWLENFYSAMAPATGSLKLTDSFTFHYKFANDPRAAVHIGWTIGIAAMAPDIVDKIRRFHAEGVKQIIIEGHSQGGALAYLLSSYLHYMVADGSLPHDLVIKTYCSAAPKPGNLFYSYDFDYINRGGWAFHVVSPADWVPQTPFTIQTLGDFSKVNPFVHAKKVIRKQPFFARVYISHEYRRLNNSAYRAQHRFEKNLGKRVYKRVRAYLPQYEQPAYIKSGNYAPAGTPVVLQPDEGYYQQFSDSSSNVFIHHLFDAYYYLATRTNKETGR